MTNTRFSVEIAPVDLNNNDHVGYLIRDGFTGFPVRDGKGEMILVYGDRVIEVQAFCNELNTRTEGITREESAAFTPEVLAEAA
jgi:hypothetical protein